MRNKAVYLTLLACTALLAACESGEAPPPEETVPVALTVSVGELPDTLDPGGSAVGETIFYHLYENLLRWEDDGSGWGTTAFGQAESYTMDTDYAGNATYTFTLRDSAKWSDGRPVTSSNYIAAWRRLADPKNALPHRELLSAVSGYAEVQETGDTGRLAVSAPDEKTFVVTLNGNSAYFLPELCAGAYTMPIREDLMSADQWGKAEAVTNGAYTAAEFAPDLVRLVRSAAYYDAARIGPEEIRFVAAQGPEADYQRFADGTLDLVTGLPDRVLQEAGEDWTPEPVTSVDSVLLNTCRPPFDDPAVRAAFRLAVDTNSAAEELGLPTVQGAAGLIPYGVADYGQRPPDRVSENGEKETSVRCWDFRTHSLEKVTVPAAGGYEENCREAKRLLAQAGYPQGKGFPQVEYVYVENEEDAAAIAKVLQRMWREQLGVTVAIRGMSQEEYDALLFPEPQAPEVPEMGSDGAAVPAEGTAPAQEAVPPVVEEPEPDFQMAARRFTAAYNDAAALLEYWQSGRQDNPSGYANEAFDLAIQAARTAGTADVRDALLHDAEAVLLEDAPVIPVCYPGGSYRFAEKWAGLYRSPDGVYFLHHIAAA